MIFWFYKCCNNPRKANTCHNLWPAASFCYSRAEWPGLAVGILFALRRDIRQPRFGCVSERRKRVSNLGTKNLYYVKSYDHCGFAAFWVPACAIDVSSVHSIGRLSVGHLWREYHRQSSDRSFLDWPKDSLISPQNNIFLYRLCGGFTTFSSFATICSAAPKQPLGYFYALSTLSFVLVCCLYAWSQLLCVGLRRRGLQSRYFLVLFSSDAHYWLSNKLLCKSPLRTQPYSDPHREPSTALCRPLLNLDREVGGTNIGSHNCQDLTRRSSFSRLVST